MQHLSGLGLKNFRVFEKKQWLIFAPITILTGTNSSGKSSLISAIEIISESNKREEESFDERIMNEKIPALKDLDFFPVTPYF